MDKMKVASELVRVAKALMAVQFDTKKEMEQYKEDHDVRPGTKLEVKKDDSSTSGESVQKPKSNSDDFLDADYNPTFVGQGEIANKHLHQGSSWEGKHGMFYDSRNAHHDIASQMMRSDMRIRGIDVKNPKVNGDWASFDVKTKKGNGYRAGVSTGRQGDSLLAKAYVKKEGQEPTVFTNKFPFYKVDPDTVAMFLAHSILRVDKKSA